LAVVGRYSPPAAAPRSDEEAPAEARKVEKLDPLTLWLVICRPNPSDRSDQSLADLRHFAEQASDLDRRCGADTLNPRDIGPVVGHLMDDARQNDRSMRESNVFPRVEWAASIRLLEQMATIVRYQ